jgi:hypothetical protein
MHILSHDDVENFAPLNTQKGQTFINQVIDRIGGVDLITFDNIVSLISGEMKDKESWRQILPWILYKSSLPISVTISRLSSSPTTKRRLIEKFLSDACASSASTPQSRLRHGAPPRLESLSPHGKPDARDAQARLIFRDLIDMPANVAIADGEVREGCHRTSPSSLPLVSSTNPLPSHGGTATRPGRRAQPKKSRAHDQIIALRKRNYYRGAVIRASSSDPGFKTSSAVWRMPSGPGSQAVA